MAARIQRGVALPPRLAAGQRFVEVVGARAGESGDDGGGGAGAGAGLDEGAEGIDGEADIFVVLGGGRGGDDEDDLAFDIAAEAAGQLAEGAAGDLLVDPGQLAAGGGLAVRREGGEGGEGLADPAGALERHHRLGRAQDPLHLPRPPRQEALEAPLVGRQAGGDQRHRHHRGAGQDRHLERAVDAAADQLEAGVGDRRHPRVGDERDDVPALDPLRQLQRPRGFVALVEGDEAGMGADPQAVEQGSGLAGVLAGDVVGVDERVAHPHRDVVEVADRRRADDEATGHQPPPFAGSAPPAFASSVRASAAAPIIPASLPSVASRIGVLFIGSRPRSRTSRRAGSSRRSPAAMTPPPTTIACGWKMLAKLAQATPSRLPISSKTSIATSSPARAASVATRPSISLPSSSALPSAESGELSPAARASRPSAVPEASDSTQPWFGQLPWHGGPSTWITVWPSSAPAPVEPREISPRRIRPPPIPVPTVSITVSGFPCAAP